MKYYWRKVKVRMWDAYYKRSSYNLVMEVVYTDDIEPFNKRKHIKFTEMGLNKLEDYTMYHRLEPNIVYRYNAEW